MPGNMAAGQVPAKSIGRQAPSGRHFHHFAKVLQMRWFWIDRFISFESGRRAVAIKNVSLAEDHLADYVPGYPVMPASLMLEGMAQTGGLLVGQIDSFRQRVVLAKVASASFSQPVVPGDTLTYTALLESVDSSGAIVAVTSHVGDALRAEARLVFAFLDDRVQQQLFQPDQLLQMLRVWRLFDVGRQADGSPLTVPQWLRDAELAMSP